MGKTIVKRILEYTLFGFVIILLGFSFLVHRADAQIIGEVKGYEAHGGTYFFEHDNAEANIVLYPGGMVHPKAYLKLGEKLSHSNFNVYIPKMPFHLPILDSDSALRIDLDDSLPIFIGGHSLGGVAAAKSVYDNEEVYSGLFLLAAYHQKGIDLSAREIPILSLTAQNDGVMDRDQYENGMSRLNQALLNEVSIPGGNHAYFGSYGEQSGDNEATITNSVQIEFTSMLIQSFILENKE